MPLRRKLATGSPGATPASSRVSARRAARPARSPWVISFAPSLTAGRSPNWSACDWSALDQGISVSMARRCWSPPLEHRLALLVEGADALVAVLGVHQAIIRLDLEAEGGAQIHLRPVLHRFL